MSIQNLTKLPEESIDDETDIESGSEIEPSCEFFVNTSFIGFATQHNSSADDEFSSNTYRDATNETRLRDNIVNITDGAFQTTSSYDNLQQYDGHSEHSHDSGSVEARMMIRIGERGWCGGVGWIWACLMSFCTCLRISED
jgi:hypothetical protein